mgnify:CR=1 FL=1
MTFIVRNFHKSVYSRGGSRISLAVNTTRNGKNTYTPARIINTVYNDQNKAIINYFVFTCSGAQQCLCHTSPITESYGINYLNWHRASALENIPGSQFVYPARRNRNNFQKSYDVLRYRLYYIVTRLMISRRVEERLSLVSHHSYPFVHLQIIIQKKNSLKKKSNLLFVFSTCWNFLIYSLTFRKSDHFWTAKQCFLDWGARLIFEKDLHIFMKHWQVR